MGKIIEVDSCGFLLLEFDAFDPDLCKFSLVLAVIFLLHPVDAAFLLRLVFLAHDNLLKADFFLSLQCIEFLLVLSFRAISHLDWLKNLNCHPLGRGYLIQLQIWSGTVMCQVSVDDSLDMCVAEHDPGALLVLRQNQEALVHTI